MGGLTHKSIDKSDLQRECVVREDFRGIRVRFFEIFRDQKRVGNTRPSGWVVNSWQGIVVATIVFLRCRRNSQFPEEWLDVRELDPFGFVRNAFKIEGVSGKRV